MTAASPSARYHHRRPFDKDTYDAVRHALPSAKPTRRGSIAREGLTLELAASDVLRLTLRNGPQIVHLQAWNASDPDERIWTNETSSKENGFLVRGHRLWGTMARFRPLLTVVEDSLTTARETGGRIGPHHFVLGLAENPLVWRVEGGDPSVATAWDRFRALLAARGVDPGTYRDHVSLFAQIRVDVATQRFDPLPSSAQAGDSIALYAEIPLVVALVPSPYRGGGTAARFLDGSVRQVDWEVVPVDVPASGWPYPGVPYPDLTPYLGPDGRRS